MIIKNFICEIFLSRNFPFLSLTPFLPFVTKSFIQGSTHILYCRLLIIARFTHVTINNAVASAQIKMRCTLLLNICHALNFKFPMTKKSMFHENKESQNKYQVYIFIKFDVNCISGIFLKRIYSHFVTYFRHAIIALHYEANLHERSLLFEFTYMIYSISFIVFSFLKLTKRIYSLIHQCNKLAYKVNVSFSSI